VGEAPIVFVVDDDAQVRDSLTRILGTAGIPVRCFASAGEFLERPRADELACLVLDVQLPGTSGLELQDRLVALEPGLPIVFISGHADVAMSVRAMKAGAVEFLVKPFTSAALLEAVDEALRKGSADRKSREEVAPLRLRYSRLTERERMVMARVIDGQLNKQIAFDLGISEVTVKIHRGRVMQKMRCDSLQQLVHVAERLNRAARHDR
jgi:FixJ family two-component response regulator